MCTTDICYIEDDTLLAEMYVQKFRREGLSIVHFVRAKDAIEWLKTHRVRLILLDILLPEMSGFECIKVLRLIPSQVKTPIVILTNLGGSESQFSEQLKDSLGVKAYYVKAQITPAQLVSQIVALL